MRSPSVAIVLPTFVVESLTELPPFFLFPQDSSALFLSSKVVKVVLFPVVIVALPEVVEESARMFLEVVMFAAWLVKLLPALMVRLPAVIPAVSRMEELMLLEFLLSSLLLM